MNSRVTITAFDGLELLPRLKESEKSARQTPHHIPDPPSPPKGKFVGIMSSLLHEDIFGGPVTVIPPRLMGFHREKKRDPNAFYYVDRPTVPTEELELLCDAFLHKADPYSLQLRVAVGEADELGPKPRLRVRLRASNLKKPLELFIPVVASFHTGDIVSFLSRPPVS